MRDKPHILVTLGSAFTPAAYAALEAVAEVDVRLPSQEELAETLQQYDAVLIGLGLQFTAEALRGNNRLKTIATATTGLDHIDLQAAEEQGIAIVSLRGEDEFLHTITGTAELAWGLLIALWRQVLPAAASVARYEWNREAFRGHNAYGQTLGIVGLGRLGSWMARYGNAFGMRVMAYDPEADEQRFADCGVERVGFDALLAESDAVSIHVHLTAQTERMFNAAAFQRMKDSAVLINTARGNIVDEAALLNALQQKTVAGYATDVLADELQFAKTGMQGNGLVEYAKAHDNCLIVPHIGGMTHESREATDLFMARKLLRHLE